MTHSSDGSKVKVIRQQNRVYQTRINDVEHLKQRLQEEWSRFDLSVIDHVINEWRSRLRACVKASGGHFEHYLQ